MDTALSLPGLRTRFVAALTTLAFAISCLAGPAMLWPGCSAALAQTGQLPRLGDAGGADLSPELERRIGESIIKDLRRQRAMVDDAELVDWLNGFAGRLIEAPAARGFGFEFFLLDDSSLNAFALPGGYIGVHTGLLTAAQTESELASVLAHEIGHVTQRHIARMLAKNRESSVLSLAAVVLAMLAASSNPQAAAGLVALGGSVYERQMLSFSRDAEREADRVGLDILRQSGFQANDMIAFFGRMQQATRIYESGAPDYLRTHPLTGDRMADIQNRVFELRYRQHRDAVEFHLVRARLTALADTGLDALAATRRRFEEQIENRSFLNEAAAHYGLALVAIEQSDFKTGQMELDKAATRVVPAGSAMHHPFLARVAVDLARRRGDTAVALQLAEEAIERFTDTRAFRRQKTELLIALSRLPEAIAFLEEERSVYRGDPTVLEALARAYAANNQSGLSHWANADRYVLLGALSAAREQLLIAQRDNSLDFYRLSQIDVRLREIEAQIQREDERS